MAKFLIIYFALSALGLVDATGISPSQIIGETISKEGEFPFQVLLRYRSTGYHVGSGNLIKWNIVLIPAQCIFDYTGEGPAELYKLHDLLVLVGQFDTKPEYSRNVTQISVHPEFKPHTPSNHIALLKLDRPFSDSNRYVDLIALDFGLEPLPGTKCRMSAWARTGWDDLSDELLFFEISVVPCSHSNDKFVCAEGFNRRKNMLTGVSGGGLVCNDTLTAITSNVKVYENKLSLGLYTPISYYKSWIADEMEQLTRSFSTSTALSTKTIASSASLLFFMIFSVCFLQNY